MLSTISLAIILATGVAIKQQKVAPKVEVVKLDIFKPYRAFVDDKFDDKLLQFMQYTEVGLVISLPSRYIVEACPAKLTNLSDDKGTNLLSLTGPPDDRSAVYTPLSEVRSNWWQGIHSNVLVSGNGKQVALRVRGGNLPSLNATRIKIQGSLEMTCGADEKTVEMKDLKISDKLDAAIGPFVLRWNKDFSENETRVTFGCKEAKTLRSVVFLTPSGEEIKATKPINNGFGGGGGGGGGGIKESGFGGGGFGLATLAPFGDEYKQVHFDVRTPADRCIVRVTYFDRLETLTVPVDVQVGLGLTTEK